jgi:hypothetical protein
MEDVYTEQLSRPARFHNTGDEEKEENKHSLIAADYDGEDMPTFEWDPREILSLHHTPYLRQYMIVVMHLLHLAFSLKMFL